MHCFVTVGTTEFTSLTLQILSKPFLQTLRNLNYHSLTIQHGSSLIPIYDNSILSIATFQITDSIADEILKADLIISHAGAGTILEVLENKKRLIVVVNEELVFVVNE
jgi:beta-1,4-N-acetylglucosaminyltransferase